MSERDHLTLEQHQLLGSTLSEIVHRLAWIEEQIQAAYGADGKNLVRNVSRSAEELRSFLDTKVFVENPDRKGEENARIYYKGGRRGCSSDGSHDCKSCGGHHHADQLEVISDPAGCRGGCQS